MAAYADEVLRAAQQLEDYGLSSVANFIHHGWPVGSDERQGLEDGIEELKMRLVEVHTGAPRVVDVIIAVADGMRHPFQVQPDEEVTDIRLLRKYVARLVALAEQYLQLAATVAQSEEQQAQPCQCFNCVRLRLAKCGCQECLRGLRDLNTPHVVPRWFSLCDDEEQPAVESDFAIESIEGDYAFESFHAEAMPQGGDGAHMEAGSFDQCLEEGGSFDQCPKEGSFDQCLKEGSLDQGPKEAGSFDQCLHGGRLEESGSFDQGPKEAGSVDQCLKEQDSFDQGPKEDCSSTCSAIDFVAEDTFADTTFASSVLNISGCSSAEDDLTREAAVSIGHGSAEAPTNFAVARPVCAGVRGMWCPMLVALASRPDFNQDDDGEPNAPEQEPPQ